MTQLDAVFRDRHGVEAGEVVGIDADDTQAAFFVEGDLPDSGVASAQFEPPETALASRPDRVPDQSAADAAPLPGFMHGQADQLRRERTGVQQQVLADGLRADAGRVTGAPADIIGDGSLRFVGEPQQVAIGVVGAGDGRFHKRMFSAKIVRTVRKSNRAIGLFCR